MNNLLNKGLETIQSLADRSLTEVGEKWQLVSEMVDKLPVYISLERTARDSKVDFDEKHYFIIPYRLSEVGIALHTMRCLPEGVPEINTLPKRRVFHFANEHAEALIRQQLLEQSREIVEGRAVTNPHSLQSLANDIDRLDQKMTYGLLAVGGIAALLNPVLGLGIAAQAVLPGSVGLLSKYGLRPVGDKLSQSQLRKDIKEAEQRVLSEFECASTLQLINPILQELELALSTRESEHDPLLDFDLGQSTLLELDGERWRELTETAIYHVYGECLKDTKQHRAAGLGPEDIRWLSTLLAGHI